MRWAAAVVAVLAVGIAPAGAAAFTGWDEPEQTRPVTWSLVSIDGPRETTYGLSLGYCVGEPQPTIDHIEVTWHERSAVVTVFVHYPALHFDKNEACGGVGLGWNGRLTLARSIAGRSLYDGSASPPRRRSKRSTRTLHGLAALSAMAGWVAQLGPSRTGSVFS